MGPPSDTRFLVTAHREDWLRTGFLPGLRAMFDVEVAEVSLAPRERRRRTARVMSKPEMAVLEALFFLRLLFKPALYRGEWRIAGFGGHFAVLLFARLTRAFGRRRRVYLLNFYLHRLGRNPVVRAVLSFLLTDDTRIVAQSSADADYFGEFLPATHIVHAPISKDEPPEFVPLAEAESGSYVFSGGWTNRDYDALLRTAARLRDIDFTIVASTHNKISEPVPPNVTLLHDQPPGEFERLLSRSRLVVIPLEHDVGSSGQMVLLAAMQFSKPIVVPDVGAVSDYVDDGETAALYPLGDEAALADTLRTLFEDEARARRLGAAARQAYLRQFTPETVNRQVLAYLAAP